MKKGYAIPGISEGEGGAKGENGKYRCKAFTFRPLRGERGEGAPPPPPSFQRGAGLGEGGREADFLKGRPEKPTELSQKPGLRPCCRPCCPHRTLGVLTSDFCGHFSWPRKKVPTGGNRRKSGGGLKTSSRRAKMGLAQRFWMRSHRFGTNGNLNKNNLNF